MDNHHIKNTKKDGYFSKENFAKNFGLTLDGNGGTTVVSSVTTTTVSKKDSKKSARGRPSMHSIFSVSQAQIAQKETKPNRRVYIYSVFCIL